MAQYPKAGGNSPARTPYRSSGRKPFNLARSGLVTAAILLVVLGVFAAYWRAHSRAAFHKLRTRQGAVDTTPTPGGQDPVLISRLTLLKNTAPEFVSATLLPGVGMQPLQLMVAVPGHEPYPLLAAPTTAEAAAHPAEVQSAPMHLLVSRTPFGAPASTPAYDLIGTAPATGTESETLPDGGQTTASFPFLAGPEPDVTASVTTVVNGHTLDFTVTARNNAAANRYVTFAWAPQFAVPDGDLTSFLLTLPSRHQWKDGAESDLPPDQDFATPTGRRLSAEPLDLNLVELHTEFLADGPMARVTDLRRGNLTRITGFSPGIRSVHMQADPAARTLRLSFSSLDPVSASSRSGELLEPGQSVQWHLRLEVLPPATAAESGSSSAAEVR